MNKYRRKEIEALIDMIMAARDQLNTAITNVDFGSMKEDAQDLHDQEQEYFDSMPESLQSGEKGSQAEEAAGYLSNALDVLDELCGFFDELYDHCQWAIDALENAKVT